MTIIERARKLLDTRAPAISGQGGHATTFSTACVLVWGFGLEPEEALPLLAEWNARCDPPWTQRQLMHKLRSAAGAVHKEPRGYLLRGGEQKGDAGEWRQEERRPKRVYDETALRAVQDASLPGVWSEWLPWLRSRSSVDPRTVDAGAFLDALYRPGELVMCFENMRSTGDWMRWVGKGWYKLGKVPGVQAVRAELPRGSREGMNFLMQPVDGKWRPQAHSTKQSRRTKAAVTRWPYILLESDAAPHALWLNALAQAKIRVVSVAMSGGRSLHAVVRLDKEREEDLVAELQNPNAREVLTVLGCDPQAMHGLVYPRLPATWREGKVMGERGPDGQMRRGPDGRAVMRFVPYADGLREQRLIYFNPGVQPGTSMREGLVFERD
jgi:hypothetical protein